MTTKFISAQQEIVSEPLPLEKQPERRKEVHYRVWIGNVDPQLNEFSLLQLLKKYGKIKEFDFLFHKSGPLQGNSRGFHFATYSTKEGAENAIKNLNGKSVMSKTMLVRWADEQILNEKTVPVNINLKTDLVTKESCNSEGSVKTSKKDMILSIEQKLKQMDKPVEEVPSSSKGLHPLLQKSKANVAAEEARKRMHPYHKPYKRKR